MDNLEIDGKEYVSAKRAGKDYKYTADYVGQLIRGGKIVGRKVGRSWYVEKDSLQRYVNGEAGNNQQTEKIDTRPDVLKEKEEGNEVIEPVAVDESSVKKEIIEQETQMFEAEKEIVTNQSESLPKKEYTLLTYVAEAVTPLPELLHPSDEMSHNEDSTKVALHVATPHEVPVVVERFEAAPQDVQGPVRADTQIRSFEGSHRRVRRTISVILLPLIVGVVTFALVMGVGVSLAKVVSYSANSAAIVIGISSIRDSK